MTKAVQPHPQRERLAALLIGGTAVLELVVITHHPIAPAGNGHGPLGGIASVANANLAFHAVLMLVLVGQLVGLALFARALGLNRPLVLAGLILVWVASLMLTLAMTLDGFVVSELIGSCSASSPGCTATAAQSLQIVLAMINAFSKVGFGAECLGFAAFSAAIWGAGGQVRVAAAAGVALALAPIALMLPGGRIDPGRLAEILSSHAAWGLCVAAVLARGALGSGSAIPVPAS